MGTVSDKFLYAQVACLNKARMAKTAAKEGLKKTLHGDHTLVVAFILIAIAVGLCLTFRSSVATILEKVSSEVTKAVDLMVQPAAGGGGSGAATPTPGT